MPRHNHRIAQRGGSLWRHAGTAAWWVLLAAILVNTLGFVLLPINDPDFFWHLWTGEWIREHRTLPGEFLFAVPQQTSPEFQRFTMTSYWIAQLLLAAAHEAGGMGAIVALRGVLLFLLLVLVAWRARGDSLIRIGLLALAVPVLGQFPAERPQFYSFLFAGVLLLLLGGLREPGSVAATRWRVVAVALLMALWANCHGGYVVGLGLMGAFALAESLKLLHPRLGPLDPQRLRLLLAAIAGGFLASLLNPNSWHVFRIAFLPAGLTQDVQEYRSTLEGYRLYAEPWILVYWTLLALTVLGLALRWKKPDLTTLGLVALTGYFSFTHVRHVPFFVVTAVPLATAALSDHRVVRRARPLVVALGLWAGAAFIPDALLILRDARNSAQVNSYLYPVQAASFIREKGLQGTMFNKYEWGGYLLWRLAPRRIFIDGRNADPELIEAYGRVLAGDSSPDHGEEFWRRYLGRHDIGFTVTPFFDQYSGEFYGLIDALLNDPAWVPVFASPTSLVFVRDLPENRAVLASYALPKANLYSLLLDYTGRLIADMPDFVPPYVARGDLLLRLGDNAAALRSYTAALGIEPSHPAARQRVGWLRGK